MSTDPATASHTAPPQSTVARQAIGTAAIVIMLGNLTTSILGFVRQSTIAGVFGSNAKTSAFFAASTVPQMFYDLTIGAAVSAALIPTFTELLERRGAPRLADAAGGVLALAWVVLTVLIVSLNFAARPVMGLLLSAGQLSSGQLDESVTLLRVLLPSLFFLGTSAVLLATLYSAKRFAVSAFATCAFHGGIIASALLLAHPLGILALPIGAVAGAALQALVQVPVMLRAGLRLRPALTFSPEIRAILRLYLPVAAGLVISIVGQVIDLRLKSGLEVPAITWMYYATTLTQFPIGLAVAALSFAVLPSLSSDAAFDKVESFKDTLAFGMRFVLFLTIPAAIAYVVLAVPVVQLIFQHHHFHAADTTETAAALAGYAPQIPFVGLDQLLIFAFYARKNTVTPMLVGVVGVVIYVVAGLILRSRLHVFGLALANTLQNSLHSLILLGLLIFAIGTLSGRGIRLSVAKMCIAGAAMAGVAALVERGLGESPTGGLSQELLRVVGPAAAGGALYLVVAALLRSQELDILIVLLRRLGTRAPTTAA